MTKCVLIIVCFLVMVSISPHTSANFDIDESHTMGLVMTYPEGDFRVGSEIQVTVHVFDSGEYISPDTVEVVVGSRWTDPRTIDADEASTGKWTATLTVQESDISSYSDVVEVSATVTKGEVRQVADTAIPVSGLPALTIDSTMEGGSWYIEPGDVRTFTWEVRYGDVLVDADVELHVVYMNRPSSRTPEHHSTGVFSFVYTVPEEGGSATITVDFIAEHEAPNGDDKRELDKTILYLNPMLVWAKRIGQVTSERATFDLHVSESNGSPVAGARVDLFYVYEGDDGGAEGWTEAVCDERGVARVVLDYPDIADDETSVEVRGAILREGSDQSIEFILEVGPPFDPSARDPSPYGLDVLLSDAQFGFDEDGTLEGTVYDEAEEMGSEWIHCYLITDHHVLAHTNLTTGTDGTISIDFKAPSKDRAEVLLGRALFKAPVPSGFNKPYDTAKGYYTITDVDVGDYDSFLSTMEFFRTTQLRIDVQKVEKGKPIAVTFDHPDATADWEAMLFLGNGPDPATKDGVPDWSFWCPTRNSGMSPYMGGGFYYASISHENGSFQGAITIPENLPDEGYYLWALIYDPDDGGMLGSSYYSNVVTLKVGEAATTGGGGDGDGDGPISFPGGVSWPMMLLILLVLAVIVAVAIVTVRKRRTEETVTWEPVVEEPPARAIQSTPAAPTGPYQAMPAQEPEYTHPEAQHPAYQHPVAPQPTYQPPVTPQPSQQPLATQSVPQSHSVQQPQHQVPVQHGPAYQPPPPQPTVPPPQQPQASVPTVQQHGSTTVQAPGPTTIRCNKCQNLMQIPTTRPIQVTCPNCGASGVLR